MEQDITHSKKELILNTARQILAKQGYAKTTLDDIANALGMKKSSLYYYYQNKEALLDDVINFEKEKYLSLITDALNEGKTTFEKIINYETKKFEYVQTVLKLQDLTLNIFYEIKNKIFKVTKEIQEKEISLLSNVLNEGIKRKEIKKCDTNRVAQLLLTVSEAMRHREIYFAHFTIGKHIDFSKAYEDMLFAFKLIFKGLSTK